MKKFALKYSIKDFIADNPEYKDCNIELYIGQDIIDDLASLLSGKYLKKFRIKLHYILKKNFHDQHYRKLKGYKNIYEIKFNDADNFRIYCKEYTYQGKTRIVIMAKMTLKKTQKLDKRIKKLIQSIEQTTYVLT